MLNNEPYCKVLLNVLSKLSGAVFTKYLKAKSSSELADLREILKNNVRVSPNLRFNFLQKLCEKSGVVQRSRESLKPNHSTVRCCLCGELLQSEESY